MEATLFEVRPSHCPKHGMGRHRRHRVLRPSISPKYAEHAKENLDTKEEDLDSGSDKEAYPRESYVGKTRHQKRHMSGSSSQGKAPVSLFLSRSARKRTTRNSNSTTELEIEDDGNQETGRQNLNSDKGRDIGKGKSVSCKIVLKDCKVNYDLPCLQITLMIHLSDIHYF